MFLGILTFFLVENKIKSKVLSDSLHKNKKILKVIMINRK